VEAFNARFGPELWWLEQIGTALFAVEYALRAWSAVELRNPRYSDPIWGRLRYLRSFSALVDLAAILPAILGMLGARDLRTLRLLRLLRMLKLTRHAMIFDLLWAVFREEARSIDAVLFILLLTLTISASIMYMVEGEAQPDAFSSIPAAMWWAVETLTTVGYGDMVPVTAVGKLIGGVVTVIGVAAVALFTSLITASFLDQVRLRREALRDAVETRRAGSALSAGDVEIIADIGHRLGLPAEQTAEVVEDMTRKMPRFVTCPHCGGALTDAHGEPPEV
jgi:voltage-gated potassium channel